MDGTSPPVVLKLGGSLLDLADLPQRLARLEAGPGALVVVGGGAVADHIRGFDARFGLGPEVGHWMAVRAMALNAGLLHAILAPARWITAWAQLPEAVGACAWALASPIDLLQAMEAAGAGVPHRWSFTSDSIAARFARELEAPLCLLKSADAPSPCTAERAAAEGLVDADFPEAARGVVRAELQNLRAGGAPVAMHAQPVEASEGGGR
jgi:aspartokinase-like uncharacterized kinase